MVEEVFLDDEISNVFIYENLADLALGTPTLEILERSWNKLYPSEQLQEFHQTGETDEESYYDLKSLQGYNNTLYFPNKNSVGTENCENYYLATSSPEIPGGYWSYYVGKSGMIFSNAGDAAIRPIIKLQQGIKATKNGSVWELSN